MDGDVRGERGHIGRVRRTDRVGQGGGGRGGRRKDIKANSRGRLLALASNSNIEKKVDKELVDTGAAGDWGVLSSNRHAVLPKHSTD